MGRWEIDKAKIVPELFPKYLSVILFKITITQDCLAHLVELCFSQEENWGLYGRPVLNLACVPTLPS